MPAAERAAPEALHSHRAWDRGRALAWTIHEHAERETPVAGGGVRSGCVTHSPESPPSGRRTGFGGGQSAGAHSATDATRPGCTYGPDEQSGLRLSRMTTIDPSRPQSLPGPRNTSPPPPSRSLHAGHRQTPRYDLGGRQPPRVWSRYSGPRPVARLLRKDALMPDMPSDSRPVSPEEAPVSHQGPVVLVIEDEPEIRRFLRASLLGQGYRLVEATTGEEGLQAAETRQPDLVILDLGLPDMDGLEIIRRLRSWTSVPLVVVSAREQETTKVAALDAGADDYLSKPFGVGELFARIRATLRRFERPEGAQNKPVFETGQLQVDFGQRRVLVKGKEVHLTPIEYRLLTTLARHAGKLLTRKQLLTEVWGRAYAEQTH